MKEVARIDVDGRGPNETWETDGSASMELHELRGRIARQDEDLRRADSRMAHALKIIDERMDSCPDGGQSQKNLQDVRMALSGGVKLTKNYRAGLIVEEWLKDPHATVYGLSSRLLDLIAVPS